MKATHVIASLGLAAALVVSSNALATPKDKKTGAQPSIAPESGPTAPPAAPKEGAPKKDGEEAKKPALKVGDAAPAFTLKDSTGKNVSLADFKGKVVVLEWMNPGCPVCRGKMESGAVAKMMEGSKALNKDVVFLFINSTAAMADKPAESGEYLTSHKITAPALIDGDGTVGHLYNARTTPHCFVVDANGVLVYDGAIDDQKDGGTNYVVNAVKSLKEGTAVTPSSTRPYGCGVKYASGAPKKS